MHMIYQAKDLGILVVQDLVKLYLDKMGYT